MMPSSACGHVRLRYLCGCMCVYIYICHMYVYMRVYMHIHTYTHAYLTNLIRAKMLFLRTAPVTKGSAQRPSREENNAARGAEFEERTEVSGLGLVTALCSARSAENGETPTLPLLFLSIIWCCEGTAHMKWQACMSVCGHTAHLHRQSMRCWLHSSHVTWCLVMLIGSMSMIWREFLCVGNVCVCLLCICV